MNCGECGNVNPDNAKFCKECGTPLDGSQETKVNKMVEKEVEKRLDAKKIDHIMSQVKKLSIFLGVMGVLISILGFILAASMPFYAIVGVIGIIYLILAIVLFTQRTKSMIFLTGLICTILGLFTAIIPLLIGISLLYYYNKYNKLVKEENKPTT